MRKMLKTKKIRILLITAALFGMSFFTGCSGKKKQVSAALSYMNEKYGETFELLGYEEGEFSSDIDVIRVCADGMDRDHEYIAVYPDDDDKTKFSDSYFGYLIRDDIEEEFKDILGTDDCKVYQENAEMAFPDTLNADSTIADLYEQIPNFMTVVNIYLPGNAETDYRQMTDTLESWMKAQNRNCSLNLFAANETLYQPIDRYAQDAFWRYYAEHRTADGENLFYVYSVMYIDGDLQQYNTQ